MNETLVTSSIMGHRRVAMRAILLFGSIAVSLLLGECCARLLGVRPPRSYVQPDPMTGTRLASNIDAIDRHGAPMYEYRVRTNDHGFRMNEEVRKDEPSILLLGDSFTFGWGVEVQQSFAGMLSARAAQADYPQLINAGVGGASTGHVRRRLEQVSRELDLCGAIYFMNANDVLDNVVTDINYRTTTYHANPNGSVALTDAPVYSPFKRAIFRWTPYSWALRHSHLFALARSALVRGATNGPSFSVDAATTERDDLAVRVTLAHLELLRQAADDQRMPLLIVWIPPIQNIFVTPAAVGNRYVELLEGARELGMRIVDPTAILRDTMAATGAQNDYYFPDGHYTAKGNAAFETAIRSDVLKFAASCNQTPVSGVQ